ncbi:MAG TPA: ABC transporter permease [Acidimicrobiales bacterium]|nr:ABC transporter permease [Acidimicrobiales bacterium]
MHAFLQYSVLGIVYGAVYAVAASGLVVTYSTSGVFNFAHGAVGMLAAFSYWQLTQSSHVPVPIALALILLIEAPLLGIVIERVFMRRLFGASTERALMVTLGLLVILLGLAGKIWGGETERTLPFFFDPHTVSIFGVFLPVHYLVIIGVAVAVAVGLRFLLHSTRIGVAMRAVVDDPDLVAMSGQSPIRVARLGWVIGTVLAALAGVLIAPIVTLDQTILTLFVLNGFAAAVFGRLRSLPLTFLGALIIGLGQQYVTVYLPSSLQTNWLPNPVLALPMLFLFVALLVLPQERLRAAGRVTMARIPRVANPVQGLTGAAVVVVLSVIGAFALSTTWQASMSQGLIFGIVALSLVLLTGYAGQVSLGQFAFVGIGAFTMGKIAGGGSWLGMLAAVGIAAAIGVLVALPTLRLRGLYLALATLAFAQFTYYVFFSNEYIFNQSGSIFVKRVGLPGISLASNKSEMVFLGVAFALCSLFVLAIRRGTFGRRLVALSDSPAACATVGLNVKLTRLAVFGISAGLAGLAGALYGGLQGPVGSNDFPLLASLFILLLLVVWGVRTVSGALLAGITYATLLAHAGSFLGLLVGAGVILIGWLPNGLIGSVLPDVQHRLRATFGGGGGGDVVPRVIEDQPRVA